METNTDLLDQIRIASPCSASWEEMRGDERVRFCEQCRLNVYNLSAMSEREVEALVREREGRLCVRFYERPDGTMLTRNCPVGFHDARRRVLVQLAAVVAGGAAMLHSAFVIKKEVRRVAARGRPKPPLHRFEPVEPSPQPQYARLGRLARPHDPKRWHRDG